MAAKRKVSLQAVVDFIDKERPRDRSGSIGDVIGLAQSMADALESAIARHDRVLHVEFRSMMEQIHTLRQDVVTLRPDQMRSDRLPEAGRELEEIVNATEGATNTIMEAAETLMAADDSDHAAYKALVDEKMVEIFEACSFQDITGQRVAKVVRTLTWLEERLASLAERLRVDEIETPEEETDDERRRRELILNGPQVTGAGVSQDDIDALFL
ncbi:MAG: protein phosphatase CheZ [Hyphomicrobiaceae bacterium]|nr:protein phosphatase CheZ [Hyphomicrobiaceae bacterium]